MLCHVDRKIIADILGASAASTFRVQHFMKSDSIYQFTWYTISGNFNFQQHCWNNLRSYCTGTCWHSQQM